MRFVALTTVALIVALLAAGCGGGSGSSSSTPESGGANGAGAGGAKKATAPNAPAGSKVVACKEGAAGLEGLRAAAVDCGTARETMTRWAATPSCALTAGASRGSCSLGDFRCQAVRAGEGVAVSCARPGADIAWVVREPGSSG